MTKEEILRDVKYLIDTAVNDSKRVEVRRLIMDEDSIPMWSLDIVYIRSRKYNWMEFSITWQKDGKCKFRTYLHTRITNPAYNPKAIEDLINTYIEAMGKNPEFGDIE